MPRTVVELNEGIRLHKELTGHEPSLIMLHSSFIAANSFYLRGRLYSLCCGKGMLYSGIPAITTSSAMVEDFLICY